MGIQGRLLTCKEFLELDLLEYDILVCNLFNIYRGPIQTINKNNDYLVILAKWLARFMPCRNAWKWLDPLDYSREFEFFIPKFSPRDCGTMISLVEYRSQSVCLIPPNISKLESKDVVGYPIK